MRSADARRSRRAVLGPEACECHTHKEREEGSAWENCSGPSSGSGALTFGGGYAMIALLDHECVEKHQWLTADELMDITVVAESTPGPIAINCATYTGWRQAGLAGAVSATVGIVLPAFLLFWGLSFCFEELLDLPVLEWAFRGIRAAVAVLVLEAGAKMLLKLRKKPQGRSLRTGLAAAGFGLALLARVLGWPISTIELMLLAGIAGVLLFRDTPAGKGAENP